MNFRVGLHALIWLLLLNSCKTNEQPSKIQTVSFDRLLVLPTNLKALSETPGLNDPLVDAIIQNLSNGNYIACPQVHFLLSDGISAEFIFEIQSSLRYNGTLPDSLPFLTAVLRTQSVEILDNSGFGYPDAITAGEVLSSTNHWSASNVFVLRSQNNTGLFEGMQDRYLGFRYLQDSTYRYGWMRLQCSSDADTIRVMDAGWNNYDSTVLRAGESD